MKQNQLLSLSMKLNCSANLSNLIYYLFLTETNNVMCFIVLINLMGTMQIPDFSNLHSLYLKKICIVDYVIQLIINVLQLYRTWIIINSY